MGKNDGGRPSPHWRSSHHPALADSSKPAAQAVLVAPHHVCRGDSPSYPIRLGYLLQSEIDLGAFAVYKIAAGPSGVSTDLKNLSPDVCRYRNRHRQRPRFPICPLGALAGQAVSAAVCRSAYAEFESAGAIRLDRNSVDTGFVRRSLKSKDERPTTVLI